MGRAKGVPYFDDDENRREQIYPRRKQWKAATHASQYLLLSFQLAGITAKHNASLVLDRLLRRSSNKPASRTFAAGRTWAIRRRRGQYSGRLGRHRRGAVHGNKIVHSRTTKKRHHQWMFMLPLISSLRAAPPLRCQTRLGIIPSATPTQPGCTAQPFAPASSVLPELVPNTQHLSTHDVHACLVFDHSPTANHHRPFYLCSRLFSSQNLRVLFPALRAQVSFQAQHLITPDSELSIHNPNDTTNCTTLTETPLYSRIHVPEDS